MILSEVRYTGEIVATYNAELRACKNHKELQALFDERWPWLTDAGGLAHMLCRRTFYEWQQWLGADAQKAKGQFMSKAMADFWLAGAARFGVLAIPMRLLWITLGSDRLKVEDSLFLRRLIDTGAVDKFFADCDSQLGPTPAVK